MKIRKVANIIKGQDGAVFNNYLFRFDTLGLCSVYDINGLEKTKEIVDLKEISGFYLDKSDILKPHSNSVMFGNEYYSATDEFPLLYTNIYNNYAKEENKLKGVCLVYRLQRDGTNFSSTLVRIIEIGFTEDSNYWKSAENEEDVRPYGNFTIDREKGVYYAFTMRDKTNSTRFFAFDLPKAEDGAIDKEYNVNKVTLNVSDIKEYFDCEYQRYIQGACVNNGKIYSLEGFTGSENNPPALRIIDTVAKRQLACVKFGDLGLNIEPELIDFQGDVCYYGDSHGNLYIIEF